MNNLILIISNQVYIKYAINMLISLNKYNPSQVVYALLVNVDELDKKKLLSCHKKLEVIEEKISFLDEAAEKGFLVCCRSWYVKKLMKEFKSNVFYCDVDVVFMDSISPFFDWLIEYDFAARAKTVNPKITVNAGMLWFKYSLDNIKCIDYWIDCINKIGIKWMSDQIAFNEMINKYRKKVRFGNFPIEYNGLSSKSKIIHYKSKSKKGLI